MKIYSEYKDYQEYVDIQTETNKAKIDVVWVSEIEVIQLYNYIANKYSDEIHYVMCHGARNGTEVKYFTESLPNNWVVEGNDISETANAYELHQWDMQNYNEDWKQKFTIQYTNSFDHVYDPQKTLKTFMKQCTDDGSVFIQWTENLILYNQVLILIMKAEFSRNKTILRMMGVQNYSKELILFSQMESSQSQALQILIQEILGLWVFLEDL